MKRAGRSWFLRTAVLFIAAAATGLAAAESAQTGSDIHSGYYAREQNDGELARATHKSHYIRFFPNNRIVRLIIPFPYSTDLSADTIRQVFDIAAKRSTGSAYISDTFGVLQERVVAHLDTVRLIDGVYYFDCGVAVPCRIEFTDKSMRIMQKGLVKEHVTAYELVPD